jgi:hypothetical protein
MNAYRDFLACALFTPKTDVADETIPTDSPALKQQGERVVGDPAASTSQARERIALVYRLPDSSAFPE